MLTYKESFKLIEGQSSELKKTCIGTFHLIQELLIVNMIWEKFQFSIGDDREPAVVANSIVHDAAVRLNAIRINLNSYRHLLQG